MQWFATKMDESVIFEQRTCYKDLHKTNHLQKIFIIFMALKNSLKFWSLSGWNVTVRKEKNNKDVLDAHWPQVWTKMSFNWGI